MLENFRASVLKPDFTRISANIFLVAERPYFFLLLDLRSPVKFSGRFTHRWFIHLIQKVIA